MLSVYKYEFEINDYATVELPVGAEILHMNCQFNTDVILNKTCCLWALVRTDIDKMPIAKRKLRICGTGHPIEEYPRQLRYINTFRMGQFLWFHAFEILEN